MPNVATAARSKTVETKITEEVPVTGTESQALGMPWQDYLASIPADELEITDVKIYRTEPRILEGFVLKNHERIDEPWIQENLGGGVFSVRISSKSGKSHFERGIKIAGAPKLTDAERASNPSAAASIPHPRP